MKKYLRLLIMFCVMFIGIGPVSAFNFQTGTFGVKYNGVVFADFNYNTIYGGNFGLPLHPGQNPNDISGNVWGIFSMQGTHSLLDNNPENNLLSGAAYYTPGSDGKYYFAVFGGLTYLSDSGSIPGFMRLKAALGGAYLKVYEVDAADAGVYDAAVLSGPNVPGKGAFGTFGTQIINAPSATLWLDTVFSPGTMIYYDGAFQAGELELLTQNSSVTGSTEAYLDVVGGTAAPHIKIGVFPITFPNAPDRADLKAISDLTANVRSGAWLGPWTSSAQDPITGVFQEPSCCIDIEKEVSLSLDNPDWHDADTCSELAPVTSPHGAMYRLIVKNCGDVALNNVLINDPTLGISNSNIGTLAPQGQVGDSKTLTGSDISQLGWDDERCVGTEVINNTASATGTCADPVGGTESDEDSACWQCESPANCRVTAGGNKDGITTPCLTNADGKIINAADCANDTNGNGKTAITHTWGGQAGAQPRIDCNWTHHLKNGDGTFGFHSNECYYIQCSDPGLDCVPAADGKPETRQIDFSGRGRFTHKNGGYATFPNTDLCYMVHMEDIGEPGRGGRWPSATAPCTHCPGTPVENGAPMEDCKNCTDFYQIVIYDRYDPDPATGYCRGNPLWYNGGPIGVCPDVPNISPNPPYNKGFFTRAGNVQMHPDNNGAPIFSYEVFCSNGIDDDGDGKVDCNDKADCKNDPACQ